VTRADETGRAAPTTVTLMGSWGKTF